MGRVRESRTYTDDFDVRRGSIRLKRQRYDRDDSDSSQGPNPAPYARRTAARHVRTAHLQSRRIARACATPGRSRPPLLQSMAVACAKRQAIDLPELRDLQHGFLGKRRLPLKGVQDDAL